MKKSLLFLSLFVGVFLITFSVSMYLTPVNNIETSLGDEYEVLGAKSGFIDGEAYTTGVRFYNGSYYNELKASTTLAASNTWYLPTADGTDGQVLKTDGNGNLTWLTVAAGGSVTYVGIAVPTGLTVSGTPITTSGTTTIALASGYEIPKTASTSNWQTAYSWGNHATAGYITQAYASSTYQLLGDYVTLAYASTTYGLIASNNTWTGQNTFGNASTTNLTVTTNSQLGTVVSGTWNGTAITVGYGGTGATTLTDHGVLVGSGTGAITPLTVGTNGQLLIGSTGADPVFATFNCDANLTCTAGAGTLEIDVDDNFLLNTGDTGTGVYDFGGATSFEIPNGSSVFTNTTVQCAIDTTSGQLRCNTGSVTSTFMAERYLTVSYATSTAWTGTTTINASVANRGQTFSGARCYSDTGSTAFSIGDGTNKVFGVATSSTGIVVTQTLGSNNTFTAGEKVVVEIGNPASMPTKTTCKFIYTLDAD